MTGKLTAEQLKAARMCCDVSDFASSRVVAELLWHIAAVERERDEALATIKALEKKFISMHDVGAAKP